jgi:hypothetical protein
MNIPRVFSFSIFSFLLSTFAFLISPSAFSQGSLTPPGPPAPTMKTLDQLEARTPLAGGSSAITLSTSGSYYLTGSLTVATGDAITINASQVTLDLNGFTISSTAATATGAGILLGGGVSDIHILNGHIKGGVTYSAGSFTTGPGFNYGIYSFGAMTPTQKNVHISGISVSGVRVLGINSRADVSVVDHCYVDVIGAVGITASSVSDCVANVCGTSGISASTVSNSRGNGVNSATGIGANTAINCVGTSEFGDGLFAQSATNCFGQSTAGGTTGSGINAFSANNCYGQSDAGRGVTANSANGCYGFSSSFVGIAARSATGCYGQTTSGTGINLDGLLTGCASNCVGIATDNGVGLVATSAMNCYGESVNGNGMAIGNTAMACRGRNLGNNAPGLVAEVAIGCSGSGAPNVLATHNYLSGIGPDS